MRWLGLLFKLNFLPLDARRLKTLKRGGVLFSQVILAQRLHSLLRLDGRSGFELFEQTIRILQDSALQAFRLQRQVHLVLAHTLSHLMHLKVYGPLRGVLQIAFMHLLCVDEDPITTRLSCQKRPWRQYGALCGDH